MSCKKKKEEYGLLGPPKTQPRKLNFAPVSGKGGRREEMGEDSLENLPLKSEVLTCDTGSITDFDERLEIVSNIGIIIPNIYRYLVMS